MTFQGGTAERRGGGAEVVDHAIAHRELGVAYRHVLDLTTRTIAGFEAQPYSKSRELPTAKALFLAAHAAGRVAELGALFRERAVEEAPRERLYLPLQPGELDALFFAPEDDPLFRHPADVVLQVAPRNADGTLALSRELVAVLRSHRIGIAFTDFGGARSSIGDVLDFQPSVVKLDPEMLVLAATSRGRRYFAALVAWAREVGVQVSARVSNQAQLELVASLGVRFAEGPALGTTAGWLASSSESG